MVASTIVPRRISKPRCASIAPTSSTALWSIRAAPANGESAAPAPSSRPEPGRGSSQWRQSRAMLGCRTTHLSNASSVNPYIAAEVDPQHPLQPDRWPAALTLRVKRPQAIHQPRPRHHLFHLGQKLVPSRLLFLLGVFRLRKNSPDAASPRPSLPSEPGMTPKTRPISVFPLRAGQRIAALRYSVAAVYLARPILFGVSAPTDRDRPKRAGSLIMLTRQHRQYSDLAHAHQVTAGGAQLHQQDYCFVKGGGLLAQLPPSSQMGRTIGASSARPASRISMRATPRSRRDAEGIEHTADMVRQSRCHADELGSRAQQGQRSMGIERFYCTERYHPVRMICASPSASIRS
jgi:hypothetical protein